MKKIGAAYLARKGYSRILGVSSINDDPLWSIINAVLVFRAVQVLVPVAAEIVEQVLARGSPRKIGK